MDLRQPFQTLLLLAAWICAGTAHAQSRLPIIDMHLHAMAVDSQGPPPLAMCTPIDPMPAWDPATPYAQVFMGLLKHPPCKDPVWSPESDEALMRESLATLEKNNIIAVTSGPQKYVKAWLAAAPGRVLPSLLPDYLHMDQAAVEELRDLKASGELIVLGELGTQYEGIAPADPRLEPLWKAAEDLDLPVGLHLGPGPPGVAYLGAEGYRAHLHSALTIEEVLVKHPRLRIYLMHAGYPMIDDLLAVMYAHPQVYVDVGVIVYSQPRAAFYRYLQSIFDAGFGNRVMFGSDQMVWPGLIERSIQVIDQAPFLDEKQKRDLLYNNAARFLRLSDEQIKQHHAM